VGVLLGVRVAARLTLPLSRDPTVRLDLSASINWMNRRLVLPAIQQGQLDIEPVSSETYLQEHAAAQSGISGLGTGSSIICGLCGAFIMHDSTKSSMFQRQLSLPTNAWSTSLFMSRQNSRSITPVQSTGGVPTPTTIYIFKLATDSFSTPQPGRSRPMYPLCTSGWCLNRLRTTCNLWAFVRTGIMEKVWEEAGLVASRRTSTTEIPSGTEPEKQQESPTPPQAPPLRGRFGKLWERASSLGAGVVEKISTAEPEKDKNNEEDAKKLPSPPPEPEDSPPKRFVPPLPPVRTQVPVPAQLPPRNQNRVETHAPPTEELVLQPDENVLFEHGHHDKPQPAEPSTESETVVEKPRPPLLPPRAPRHPPTDIARPETPSTIPLPDSQPSTPITTTKAERRISLPPASTTSDPGRSSSPAPGSSSTPPRIPRRAPARVRPVLSSTPLNQPPVEPTEEKKEVGVDPSNEPAIATVEEITTVPTVDVANRPDPEINEPTFTTKVEPREPDVGIAEVSSPIPVADGSAAPPVDDIHHGDGDGGGGLINNHNLVGDKTWEEKTWREVVRLREEMFHARIGIFR